MQGTEAQMGGATMRGHRSQLGSARVETGPALHCPAPFLSTPPLGPSEVQQATQRRPHFPLPRPVTALTGLTGGPRYSMTAPGPRPFLPAFSSPSYQRGPSQQGRGGEGSQSSTPLLAPLPLLHSLPPSSHHATVVALLTPRLSSSLTSLTLGPLRPVPPLCGVPCHLLSA